MNDKFFRIVLISFLSMLYCLLWGIRLVRVDGVFLEFDDGAEYLLRCDNDLDAYLASIEDKYNDVSMLMSADVAYDYLDVTGYDLGCSSGTYVSLHQAYSQWTLWFENILHGVPYDCFLRGDLLPTDSRLVFVACHGRVSDASLDRMQSGSLGDFTIDGHSMCRLLT